MTNDARTTEASRVMVRFADRTGLTSGMPSRRYLWTDAFAVCNLFGLARATGDAHYHDLALRLIHQVHHELGRHRPDDRHHSGWITGLPNDEAEAHPTRGGLRIGKPLPERDPTEALDPDLEWDRDGQYFHYLTKWMHALDQAARRTRELRFHVWARELARTAHRAFTYGPPGRRQMTWKLSIDLSRPLVRSMGQHDPLDGFVTCTQLDATATGLGTAMDPSLTAAAADFAQMIDRDGLTTHDALGLGGLLMDACRLAQLDIAHPLIASLLAATVIGLRRYRRGGDLEAPAHQRLAFRELGLAIGLAGVSRLDTDALMRKLDAFGQAHLVELAEHVPLRTEIQGFWLEPHHRSTATWILHADINDVMLATSLAPEGLLALGS